MSSERRRKAGRGAWRPRLVSWLRYSLLLLCLFSSAHGGAQNMQVPVGVQAELIAKVAGFDRNYAARAGGKATILLVAMPNDAASMRAALEMKSALAKFPLIGDLPHEEQIVTFTGAGALADQVRSRRAAVVYFGPGFGPQVPAIRDALSSVNVLSVGAVPDYVPQGMVLGFDLVSGRPKLLVHVQQARKQQVAFPASVLNLMKIFPS